MTSAALDGRPSRELASVEGLFDADGYRALSSDIVAHLVFTHQAGMTNLLTRASWEARAADPLLHPPFTSDAGEEARVAAMMDGIASEVVDYLLFIDEAKLTDRVRGASGFAERFSNERAARPQGTLAARARPESAPDEVSLQLPDLLAGVRRVAARVRRTPSTGACGRCCPDRNGTERYQSALSLADRQAIVEILRDTKKDLPPYFQNVVR